jgi:CheY-like chemotaxis protein
MPGMNGEKVMQKIRSNHVNERIPIIFLTGMNDKDRVVKILEQRPDGYLLKSMDRPKLIAAIDDFFEKRKYQKLHDNNIQ